MRNSCAPRPAPAGALLGAALLLLTLAAAAQQSGKRDIRGQVLDENEKAVATAIVYLKNMTTKKELSTVTNKDGRYQFGQLSAKDDYELRAEWQQQKSPIRKVSQFDPRERIVINLMLEPPSKPESKGAGEDKEEKKEKD